MKRRVLRLIPVILSIVLILILFTSTLTGQELSKDQALSQLIVSSLASWHYSPMKLGNDLSEKVYTLYINNLDYNKRFFTQTDLKELAAFKFKIDDELRNGTTEFVTVSWKILQKRILEVKGFIDEYLQEPLNFTENEYLELDAEKRDYPQDSQELKVLWEKMVKYQTLNVYMDLLLEQEAKDTKLEEKFASIMKKPFQPEIEAKARAKVQKDFNRTFDRLLQEKSEERYHRYLNAVAGSFDPHTNYFAPKAQEDFEIEMTGMLEGIGALLQEEGDYIKVVSIVPGGPSWRQGQLKAGDLILKVAQKDEEPIDLANMPVDEVVKYIRGKKGTEVILTVKKPEGQIEVISIIRDVVVLEESYAKSLVIETEKNGKKFGYISLPSFYHDFERGGRTSAGDVKLELEKLKKEKVDGVILDLRNNGGGALDDAVKMAGLFIESGPIVQVKDQKGKIKALNDPDRGIVYDGPLIVMINSLSASASEILAAALQDYGRAVVVGSTSFGKGSVQELVDLDYLLDYIYPRSSEYKPLGSLKLTIEKFYRINGGSTQYKGVSADIALPDPYAYLDIGEKSLDYAMPWDQVKPLSYKKWDGQHWRLEDLRKNSEQRIASNPNFDLVKQSIAQVKEQKEQSVQPLKISEFLEKQKMNQLKAEKLDDLKPREQAFNFQMLEKELKDSIRKETNQEWLEQISSDIYLEEAIWILNDLTAAGVMLEAA
jgi:carboxyl-terminal processing protease